MTRDRSSTTTPVLVEIVYQWSSPMMWFLEVADDIMMRDVITTHVDHDAIQDMYQNAMVEDGYFDKMHKCPGCKELRKLDESCQCTGCGKLFCDDCLSSDHEDNPVCWDCYEDDDED